MPDQYQLLPPLTDEEFESLKADIAARGVMVPVELDERGVVLDGHHRLRACAELGITEYPTIIRPGLTEQEKRIHVRALNLCRRHLNREQKREVIADILRDQPERSNRDIAEQVQVDHHTVGSVRDELDAGGEIPHLDRSTGRDGKSYPASRPAIIAPTQRDSHKALVLLAADGADTVTGPATVQDLKVAVAGAVREARAAERYEAAEAGAQADLPEAIQVVDGDFREHMADLPDNSVDMIFTDPPYDEGALPLYADLAEVAARVLKPGGSLIAYCGHYAVGDLIASMGEHLRFWWLCGVKHGGGAARLPGKWVFVEWKPLVWFVKNGRRDNEFVADMVTEGGVDKQHHDWQQSTTAAAYYIEHLTQPGELVVDPFLGSGTTLLAAVALGRRGIGYELDSDTANIARQRISERQT